MDLTTNSPVNTLFSSAIFGSGYGRVTLADGVTALMAEDELYVYLEMTRPSTESETNAPPLRERDRVALALNNLPPHSLDLAIRAKDDIPTRERKIAQFLCRLDAVRAVRNALPSGWHIARSIFQQRRRTAFGETEILHVNLIGGLRKLYPMGQGDAWIFFVPSSFTPETTHTNSLNNPENFLTETAHWKIYLVASQPTNWSTMRDDLKNAFERGNRIVPTSGGTERR